MGRILKYSRQRNAILDLLKNTTTHPTANWVYMEIKEQFPKVSLATVYRNLNLLADLGTIIRLDVGNGTEHYDFNTCNHYHFVCTSCHKIIDVMDMIPFDGIDNNVEQMLGVKVKTHSLTFHGECEDCINKN